MKIKFGLHPFNNKGLHSLVIGFTYYGRALCIHLLVFWVDFNWKKKLSPIIVEDEQGTKYQAMADFSKWRGVQGSNDNFPPSSRVWE